MQLIARGVAIKFKTKRCRTLPDPRDMAIKQGNSCSGIKPHRFNQIKYPLVRHKPPFGINFGPFGIAFAISDDPAAKPKRGLRCPLPDMERADRDIESSIAVRIDPADRASINPARIRFDLTNHFHRANFGRARDRTTGENSLDHINRA